MAVVLILNHLADGDDPGIAALEQILDMRRRVGDVRALLGSSEPALALQLRIKPHTLARGADDIFPLRGKHGDGDQILPAVHQRIHPLIQQGRIDGTACGDLLFRRFKNIAHPLHIQLQVVIDLLDNLLHIQVGVLFRRVGELVVQHKTDDNRNEYRYGCERECYDELDAPQLG
ncbi:hypothetical protein D3C73_971520 [compost metagenome]